MHKVLVIDGDFLSAKRLASALTESGFETLVALSESAGLKMADERSPDAIVVRDGLPQLGGVKLCKAIHHIFGLPLILLGDKPESEVYSSDLDIPTDWDYYMQLPINFDEMAAKIKVLLWRYGKAELLYRKGSNKMLIQNNFKERDCYCEPRAWQSH